MASRDAPFAAADRPIGRAALFTADGKLARALEAALDAREISLDLHEGGVEQALSASDHDTDCVLLDIRDTYDAVDDVAALQAVLPSGCRLVAIAERSSAGLQRDLVGAGADALLDLSLRPDLLDAVFGPVASRQHTAVTPPQPRHRGRIVVVLGVRGGVGATTAATAVAWLLAHELGRETALLDLDPFFGSVALALNIEPGDGLRQALERPSRLDPVFVDRAVRKLGDRLYVMSAEQPLEQPIEIESKAPLALIESLRNRYERVVVDLPRGNPAWQAPVLARADEVLLVTDLSLAGARDTMRLLSFARQCSESSHIRILSGGARQPQNDMLDVNEFRRSVGAPIAANIPFDPRAAMDAGRSGRALPKAAVRSPAGKSYRALLASIEGTQTKERSRWSLPWRR